jgi:hypothetical protein
MDNTNLDDEQLQQIRAFGKVAEEATRNIASILQVATSKSLILKYS